MRWIAGVPALLLLILFALSNSEPVSLELWPFGEFPFKPPLSLTLLAVLALGYVLGGLRVRIAEYRHRRAARRAEDAMRLMEAKQGELKAGQMLAPRA
ncbi:MAG: DUF1049 domain-containing protein [Acetobacteraceae bacterium]|nr:DUF1049 domain-containing protein [Acetobacteraceae bacterium]